MCSYEIPRSYFCHANHRLSHFGVGSIPGTNPNDAAYINLTDREKSHAMCCAACMGDEQCYHYALLRAAGDGAACWMYKASLVVEDCGPSGDFGQTYTKLPWPLPPSSVKWAALALSTSPPPPMDWKWPADANVDCKDFHPRIGGGQEEVGGWDRGRYKLANACDSSGGNGRHFHTYKDYGVNGADYVDFIFTFEDANTWCSGYRQSGHSSWGVPAFTKDIEIYTGDANFGPWTEVATDSHSTWHNGATNTFPDDGTTTEWTPTAPSKYLLVRTRTNHGSTQYGGQLTVRFLQLKLSTPPN